MYNTFEELEESIKGCNKCKLYKTRQNIVFGVGKKDARLMFIGESLIYLYRYILFHWQTVTA